MPHVLILKPIHPDAIALLESSGCRVEVLEDLSWPAMRPSLARAEAIIVRLHPIGEREVAAAPRLRVVARHGAGYDTVDVAALTRRGILLTITPEANSDAVAEHTILLMLAAARHLPENMALLREGRWGQEPPRIGSGDRPPQPADHWLRPQRAAGGAHRPRLRHARAGARSPRQGRCHRSGRLSAGSRSLRCLGRGGHRLLALPGHRAHARDGGSALPGGDEARERSWSTPPAAACWMRRRWPSALRQGPSRRPPGWMCSPRNRCRLHNPLLAAPNVVLTPHVAAGSAEAMRNMADGGGGGGSSGVRRAPRSGGGGQSRAAAAGRSR